MTSKPFYTALAATSICLAGAVVPLQVRLALSTTTCFIGIFFLAVVTLVSYTLLVKQANTNPRKFVNSMMLSTMLKLFGCGGAAFVMILATRPNIPKSSILFLMLTYVIYAVIESKFVMQHSKKN